MGFGSFMRGVIVGGLAGAVYTMLTAPRTGEETREMLREKSYELRDRATSTVEDTRARAEQALSEARTRAEATISRAKEEGQGFARDAQRFASEQSHRVEEIKDAATKTPDESGAI